MWTKALLVGIALGAAGCRETIVVLDADGGVVSGDMRCAASDLAASPPPCKAARGLSGEPIICVDFNQITMVPDAQKLPGWTFSCNGSFSWTTVGGTLQVADFGNFNRDCTVTLPVINLSDGKYSRITLSLVQRIDLSYPEQNAELFLNTSSQIQRQMWLLSGKKDVPKQQTTITLDKADLPTTLPQWLLRLSSSTTSGGSRLGWQIESIAVLGQH